MKGSRIYRNRSTESGAAIVTVILISLLLGIACIAMLSAVGASSRNGTDALSEYKAYYAAESGLQASINVFRNKGVNYGTAIGHPALAYDATDFPNGLVYTSGKVVIDSESSYAIQISDPDNSAGQISYSTSGSFLQADGISYASTRVYGSGADTLTFSFDGRTATSIDPPNANGTSLGAFRLVKAGNGSTLTAALSFRIDYTMLDPRPGTRTIRGSICTDGTIRFLPKTCGQTQTTAPSYSLMGSTITLCGSDSGCTVPAYSLPLPVVSSPETASVFAKMTAIEPYRLKIVSTGYGPNGATKQLEGIIQRNFFNDLGSSAAISMVGPNAYFNPGSSKQLGILGGSNPSITFSDAAGLAAYNTIVAQNNFNGTVTPAPEIAGTDVPDWQQSPEALDALIRQLRQTAQNSGRYFTSGPGSYGWGSFSTGTGLTFCEGNCGMSGNDSGGGILVVTGTFTTSGSPRFKGLVIVTGPGGIVRSGGGNEIFTGNIVVAPYDPNNLAAGWLQPHYDQSGGPGDTTNSDVTVDQAFDGTAAITDFMLGVAEK